MCLINRILPFMLSDHNVTYRAHLHCNSRSSDHRNQRHLLRSHTEPVFQHCNCHFDSRGLVGQQEQSRSYCNLLCRPGEGLDHTLSYRRSPLHHSWVRPRRRGHRHGSHLCHGRVHPSLSSDEACQGQSPIGQGRLFDCARIPLRRDGDGCSCLRRSFR